MLGLRKSISAVSLVLLSTVLFPVLGQEPKDQETRPVPRDVQGRIQQYFDLQERRDWSALFDIDDGDIRNRDDFVNMKIADESNPYIRVKKVSEMRLKDSMLYRASSKKWQIEGCARFDDKQGHDTTAMGWILVTVDPERGILVGNAVPAWFSDGWHECTQPIGKFPLKVDLK